ncbi:transcription factor TRY [Quercus lobata]|uniref:transcription factor TRY n=1 Tax=Quercus lobata TaxID=97700 RepID=UPI001243E915|nr:transcription factor TRY [Quercus lobata]
MDQGQKQAKITAFESEEVSSTKWEVICMTEQEEDLVYRMYRLVGQRWDLIAGRIPGRNAVEVERFWIMRGSYEREGVAGKRKVHKKENYKVFGH